MQNFLLVLRAGSQSLHRSWVHFLTSEFDLAVSWFDDTLDEPLAKYNHRCRGGKYVGIGDFFKHHPDIIAQYDYFMFVEDDLYISRTSLLKIREYAEKYKFSLCAPALSPDSFFSWPITLANAELQFRATTFVEQMCPVMSKHFLQRALPHFCDNHSGWGYEWKWSQLLFDMEDCAAIIDDAPITHTRPIGKGTLYHQRTDSSHTSDLEEFILAHKLQRRMPFVNLFGVDRAGKLVTGSGLIAAGRGGYRELIRSNIKSTAYRDACLKLDEEYPIAENTGMRRLRSLISASAQND